MDSDWTAAERLLAEWNKHASLTHAVMVLFVSAMDGENVDCVILPDGCGFYQGRWKHFGLGGG